MRLDKLLLLLDVLRFEVLPRWLDPRLWGMFNLQWAVQLLKDPDFRSWLWSETFLYAAKDPMTLAKALLPTGSALAISSYFNGLVPNAPVPALIIASLELLGEHELLKKLSSRSRFDARVHGLYGVRGAIRMPKPQARCGLTQDEDELDEEGEAARSIFAPGVSRVFQRRRTVKRGVPFPSDDEPDKEDKSVRSRRTC